jgi:hypothetical protein
LIKYCKCIYIEKIIGFSFEKRKNFPFNPIIASFVSDIWVCIIFHIVPFQNSSLYFFVCSKNPLLAFDLIPAHCSLLHLLNTQKDKPSHADLINIHVHAGRETGAVLLMIAAGNQPESTAENSSTLETCLICVDAGSSGLKRRVDF